MSDPKRPPLTTPPFIGVSVDAVDKGEALSRLHLTLPPDEAAQRIDQAVLRFSLGDAHGGLEALTPVLYKSGVDSTRVLSVLRSAVDRFPSSVDLRVALLYEYQNVLLIERLKTVEGEDAAAVAHRYLERARLDPGPLNLMDAGLLHLLMLDGQTPGQESWHASVELLERSVGADPRNVAALLILSRSLVLANRMTDAERILETTVAMEPGSLAAHRGLAELAARRGELQQALSRYERLIELAPGDCEWRMRLIDLCRQTHGATGKAADRYGELKMRLEAVQRARPKDAMAHFDLGYAYLTLTPSFTPSEEELESATFEFKLLISMKPDNPAGYWGLSRVCHKRSVLGQHLYENAIALCQQAVARNPTHARARIELGDALNGNYDRNLKGEALEQYGEATRLDPRNVEAHFKIASILRIIDQHDEAIREYERTIHLDPSSGFAVDARRSLVQARRARCEREEESASRRAARLAAVPSSTDDPFASLLASDEDEGEGGAADDDSIQFL